MGALLSKESATNEAGISRKPTRRALLIGCNYPDTKAELAGCANDVSNWQLLLTKYFGFKNENIKILTDDGKSDELPTGKTIKRELTRIVTASQPGDIAFLQFSGHGVQVPADEGGDYEEDGLDEALCPTDLNLIIDDDLRDILSSLHSDVKFTMVSDCCHSGGMLDHNEIVISGEAKSDSSRVAQNKTKTRSISVDQMTKEIAEMQTTTGQKNRSMDLATMTEILQGLAKDPRESDSTDKKIEGAVRQTLYEVHGKDATHAALATKTRDLSTDEMQKIAYAAPGKKPPMSSLIDPNKGILITGCQAHETSADVTGADGRSFGALSHCIFKIVSKHKRENGKNAPLSNHDLVLKVRRLLFKSGFQQNPCLECSVENSQANFIVW